jgi:hypothetical protein
LGPAVQGIVTAAGIVGSRLYCVGIRLHAYQITLTDKRCDSCNIVGIFLDKRGIGMARRCVREENASAQSRVPF